MRRGFSLLEAVVVLAITVTVLVTALPIAVALLREQKALTAEVLRGETLPLVHARLDADLASARSLDVLYDEKTLAPSIVLTPRDEGAPTPVWTIEGSVLTRREVPSDGSPEPQPRTWSMEGSLSVDPEELAAGRLGLDWRPADGPRELLVFEAPRPGEVLR